MADYDNSMRGVLFTNDKRTTENHPNYKGNGEVNGVEVWISAWVKKARNSGQSYLSISFENKEGQTVGVSVQAAPVDVPIANDDFLPPAAAPVAAAAEDDIPF